MAAHANTHKHPYMRARIHTHSAVVKQAGYQVLVFRRLSAPATAGPSSASATPLDSLHGVGDTLLEVVRTARTVAAHGKVAMILPVPPQDLRTVTEALSCAICKGNWVDDISQSYRSLTSSSVHTHIFNVHT